ncbi:repetitive proline-rich cell wall protein 1-like [Salvia miltiorrhiza]|uniref:repetitive proline-rich cell wall protein 1-like n=1 Tax=Salvia miltiorrhiza TaxID=226208 RepID=UPI0025AC93D9|nr:repetitive proline-rich cell wall protein 1-like [Salvia miltiorrhiza]
MRVDSLCQSFLLLSLLFGAVSLCSADDKTFEVVGSTQCADCNFKTSNAFSGLRVTIDCKLKNGDTKRFGAGELDERGEFKVSLGQKLGEECYAQLHSAAAVPCPAHNGLEASKIVLKSETNGKTSYAPAKTLQFSSTLCSSKTFWPPYLKHPPLPPHPWFKNLPKPTLPPFGHPWPPLPPLYKHKPLPPPVPVYTPTPKAPVVKPPVYTPTPKPPVVKPPVYTPKPKPPVVKPPVYTPKPPVYTPKPKPPVVKPPVYTPKPPVYTPKPKPPVVKPPVYTPKPKPPVVKPPVYTPKPKPPVVKPCPPILKKPLPPPVPVYKPPLPPPIKKKPCPPLPLPPPITKKPCPPLPKLPPKYFHHPKFGHFPPLPPSIPLH